MTLIAVWQPHCDVVLRFSAHAEAGKAIWRHHYLAPEMLHRGPGHIVWLTRDLTGARFGTSGNAPPDV